MDFKGNFIFLFKKRDILIFGRLTNLRILYDFIVCSSVSNPGTRRISI